MDILTHSGNIKAAASKITFGVYDENFEKWRLEDENGDLLEYMVDDGFTLISGVKLPEDYEKGKYLYVEGVFVSNKEWTKFVPVEERIANLEEKNTELVDALAITDETAIELYEMQMAQNAVNTAQDDALIELYEMLGGE